MAVTDLRLEFMTEIFVRESIRQYLRLHPGIAVEDIPIKHLSSYPIREQKALIASVQKAFEASLPEMDEQYKTWITARLNATSGTA